MIQPYNTTENKINKYTSMFNKLPYGYGFKSLDHQIHIYETELILRTEFPKEKGLTESILDYENKQYCEDKGIIKRKTLSDVFLFLYAMENKKK